MADFDWTTLMRREWRGNQLLVRGYQMLRAETAGFAPNPKILDLGDTRVAFFFGQVIFLKAVERPSVRVRRKLPNDPPETPDPVIELSVGQGGTWERTHEGFYP